MNLSLTRVVPKVLSARLIPAPHAETLDAFEGKKPQFRSYGLISCNLDHSLFVALDEATKASPVSVVYAKSFYAGTKPDEPLTGEAMGILAGDDDEIVREGLKSAIRALDNAPFYKTDGLQISFFPHVISSLGEYLSKESGVAAGESLAYLIAPPIESVIALDASLKAADVKLVKHFGPPTETNRGGGYLTGALHECEAAAIAFVDALQNMARNPIEALDRTLFTKRPSGPR